MIQLNSLKDNNNPYKDAGIAQSWEFAHPINKASTGPLENFTQMIYADSYNILISHINNKVTTLKESENQLVYKVYVLSKDKEKYYHKSQKSYDFIHNNLINSDCYNKFKLIIDNL